MRSNGRASKAGKQEREGVLTMKRRKKGEITMKRMEIMKD